MPEGHEQGVTHRVPETVVDHLEAIDVEEHDCDGLLEPARPLDGLLETVEQERAVGQRGQAVMRGLVGQVRLGESALDRDRHQVSRDLGDPLLVTTRPSPFGRQREE